MNLWFSRTTIARLLPVAVLLVPLYTPAQTSDSSLVAVLVRIPIPPGVDRAQLEAGMAKTVPIYQTAPGLVRKYFIISDDQKFGGIYLWENRQAAEAWFNESVVWHAGISKNTGLRADLTYFDVPIVTVGPTASAISGGPSPVAVLVRVPIPPGVDRSQLEAGMAKTVPTYQTAPGLIRKYFILCEDQKFGGIYLWENHKAAEAWFNESVVWHAGISKNTGLRADLTYFDVPLTVDGPPAEHHRSSRERGVVDSALGQRGERVDDRLPAPRFAPGQRGYALAGLQTLVTPAVPASAGKDSDNR